MTLHRVPMVAKPSLRLHDDQVEPQRQARHGAIRPAATRDREDHTPQPGHAPASGGRPSPRAGRTPDPLANAPRRRPARPEDPGRSPRDRVRGDRHGRSGPGRSNQLPRAARRPAFRRHHPPAGPPFASGRRVGPPCLHRRRRPLSATYGPVAPWAPRPQDTSLVRPVPSTPATPDPARRASRRRP